MNSRIVYTTRSERGRPRTGRRGLTYFGVALLFFGAITGIIFLLRAEKFQAETISFSGLRFLSADELRARVFQEIDGNYALLLPQRSLFLIRKNALADMLQKEFPRIRKAVLSREFPNGIGVAVEERGLWAILCNEAPTPDNAQDLACVYIDETGFVFEEAPYSVGSLIVKVRADFSEIKVGEQALALETAARLRLLKERVEEIVGSRVIQFEMLRQAPDEIRVEVDEGFSLVFLREDDFANAFRVLKTVLEQEVKEKRSRLDYIDLRFGNKVFYKLQ